MLSSVGKTVLYEMSSNRFWSKASTLNENSLNSTSENIFEEGLSEQNTLYYVVL